MLHMESNEHKIVRYTLRIDRAVFQKFRYVAEYEGRSANKELEHYIKKRVVGFEAKHGMIKTSNS